MFQRLLNDKPSVETAAPPAPAPAQDSELNRLRECRTTCQVEIDVLQGQLDKANEDHRASRKKHAKNMSWEETNSHNGTLTGAVPRIYADTPLGRAITEFTDRCSKLRAAIDEKATEVERLTKSIHAIEREVPGRLRREALEAAMPMVFELIDALCVASGYESEFIKLGGIVERSIPWEFALAGGEGIELETIMSRWLKALKGEGIKIPGDISDDSRHLPAPASAHARVQTDIGHTIHAARHGGGGFDAGWLEGFRTRARNF